MGDNERIRVHARDGEDLQWSRKAARRSGMFRGWMDDMMNEDAVYIKAECPVATLAKLGEMCEPEYAPTDDFGDLSLKELFQLVESAIYLDLDAPMIEHAQRAVAGRLDGKRSAELRELVGADDDFSESDRRAVLTEPLIPMQTAASEGPPALSQQLSLWVHDDAVATAIQLVHVNTLVELKGASRSWHRVAQRVLFSRLCCCVAELPLSEVTDVDVKMLHNAGRVSEAARLPGLQRLHWDGWEVDVPAVREVDLGEEDEEDEEGDGEGVRLLSRTATAALRACVAGEGIPPPELLLVAIVCAGSREVCGIPVEEMCGGELGELDLRPRHIGTEGAKLLACLVPSSASLTKLNLSGNHIGPEGAQSLADALRVNASLTQLDLSESKLCGLDYDGYGTYTAEGINALSDSLRVNASLTTLVLQDNNLGPQGAQHLSEALKINKSISELDISNQVDSSSGDIGDIKAEGAEYIADMLCANASLTSLVIDSNRLGDEGIDAIATALKESSTSKLASLDVSGNGIGSKGAESLAAYLAVSASLTKLYLGYNKIGPEGAKSLADALKVNASLTQLNLAGNWLCGMDGRGEGTYTAEGIKALADAVAVNASLTNLNLESNDLVYGETGYVKANTVQGSSFNEGDKVIYQGREMIVSQGKDSDGDIYIKMKPVAPDLSGVKALADAILVNASLTQLNLAANSIGSEGAKSLADALKVNASLTKISLAGNNLEEEGTKVICEAVKGNKILKELDLSGGRDGNIGGPAGAKHVADMLVVNASLKTLNIAGNELCGLNFCGKGTYTAEGITAIAEALRVNASLTQMLAFCRSLKDADKQLLRTAWRGNSSHLKL